MKNKKIIIAAILITVAVLVYLFWPNIKAMFSKPEPEAPKSNAGSGNTNASNTSTNTSTSTPIIPIKVGDSVVAAKDLVKAFDEQLNAVVKTYTKNQWIGLVTKNSNGWLTVQDTAGNLKQVQKINVKRA